MILNASRVAVAALFCVTPAMAEATVYGGVDFPQGAISFADQVVSYDPSFSGGNVPTTPYQGAFNALGIPDYSGANSCASQADCTFVSLGAGGRIVLRFTNNVLTGSGTSDDDLWIFEIGPDVEDTTVDISKNGVDWFSVGKVTGSTRGIDIDSFGYGLGDSFSFVRLTDVLGEGGTSGATVGADIDAVGAISTAAVPEPASWAMMVAGLGLLGGALRRRRALAPA